MSPTAPQQANPRIPPQPPSRDELAWMEADALQRQGHRAQALTLLEALLARQPQHVRALRCAGQCALGLGDSGRARGFFERALAIAPDDAATLALQASIVRDAGDAAGALVLLDRAITVSPRHAAAHFHRGVTLRRLGRQAEAVAAYDAALAIDPQLADAHFNRANVLQDLARLDEAIAGYRRAIDLQPAHAEAHCNLACALLLSGDYAQGLREYEWRWRSEFIQEPAPDFAQPAWRGETPLAGKTILLYSEQGLGDVIQFARFAKGLAAHGARVVLRVPGLMLPLLDGIAGVHVLVAKGAELPPFDLHCPLMSLPLVFNIRPQTLPPEPAYLKARPERVARWAAAIQPGRFNIGLCWQGSAVGHGQGRSFGLERFAPLAALPGVALYSLQKGPGSEQLAALPQHAPGMQVHDFGPRFDSEGAFLDSAAVIAQLDLVITTDTAIAHLAGALGKPVWVLLKHVPDWRWGMQGSHSPWYPSMRLFRQTQRGDWQPCFDAVRQALQETLAAAGFGAALPRAAQVLAWQDGCAEAETPDTPSPSAAPAPGPGPMPPTAASATLQHWICENHRCNQRLWAEEDLARRTRASAEAIAANKRAIDRHNQARNDATERIDECLLLALGLVDPASVHSAAPRSTVPAGARLNSETAGSMVDRLSILGLKVRAMRAQSQRADASDAHRQEATQRLARLEEQRADLAACWDALLADAQAGRAYFKVYRQFKMYNDARYNPALVAEAAPAADKR